MVAAFCSLPRPESYGIESIVERNRRTRADHRIICLEFSRLRRASAVLPLAP